LKRGGKKSCSNTTVTNEEEKELFLRIKKKRTIITATATNEQEKELLLKIKNKRVVADEQEKNYF